MLKLIEKITGLSQMECEQAIEKWGYNHSTHEGYAVILEEIEEAQEEMGIMEDLRKDLWDRVRCGDTEKAIEYSYEISSKAIMAAAELVQVAAMAWKFADSERRKQNDI